MLQNLEKWKTNSFTLVGQHYAIFETVIEKFGLNPETTLSIIATTDKNIIGRLPSGGNPKTDILVTVECDDGLHYFTISCKRTAEESVGVHQYTADAFTDVLDTEDTELRRLLNEFQKYQRNIIKQNVILSAAKNLLV